MLAKICLLLVVASSFATTEKIRYEGYKVFRITPKTEIELNLIRELENNGFSFWSGPNPLSRSSDVLVAPHQQSFFQGVLSSGIEAFEYVENVQTLIENEGPVMSTYTKGSPLAFDSYLRHDAINAFVEEQAELHEIASVINIGKSFQGRDMKVLKISTGGNDTKPIIWLDANIHAREWITGAVCTYVINEILNGNDPEVRSWADDFDWYILPSHNPDGLEYSHTTDRMWRKTRSDTPSPLGCKGADPNRNWDFKWLTGGSSTNPCSDTYAGSKAFSEVETFQTSQFIDTIADRIDMFVSLHSYSQLILIPFGVIEPFPQYPVYMEIGQRVADAIESYYGKAYTPGNIVDLLYVASGGSMDWAVGTHPNIKLTYTFELRDTGAYGFILPADQIIPTSIETIGGLKVMVKAVRDGIPPANKAALKPVIPEQHTFGHVPKRGSPLFGHY